jgi:hypothetical protein
VLRGTTVIAQRLRPGAAARAPWERSVLDDIAMRRPWNLRVKAARIKARLRRRQLTDGATVLIVNWNTREVLADVLQAVHRFSPPETKVLVVDNGSTDGSANMLQDWTGIETMLLASNGGHGVALDLGLLASTTSVTVTLDSDAIPLRSGWLDVAVRPVREGRAVLAGLRSSRDFVHPVFSAVNTQEFFRRRLSFQVHRVPDIADDDVRWGDNAWDTAELMTARLGSDNVILIDKTENPTPGLPGMTTGGVVYHHGGVSRTASGDVTTDALASWRDACTSLGLDFNHHNGKAGQQ